MTLLKTKNIKSRGSPIRVPIYRTSGCKERTFGDDITENKKHKKQEIPDRSPDIQNIGMQRTHIRG
jgi:hypothetical protein